MANIKDISNLEFDGIKDNIKEFLKSQSEFTDYDFDGSGISVMLDVMAYTTHYMGFHTNMAMNESFLDTAVLRNSVVSHAKTLGYIPKSITSSEAIIRLTFDTSDLNPSIITIDRGTSFSSNVSGNSLKFVAVETTNIKPDEEGEFAGEIKVNQGSLKTLTWTYDRSDEFQKFLIKDAGCDRETIKVTVNNVPWSSAERLSEIDNKSLVYFLQEGLDEISEIYFGNGVFGYLPFDDQEVVVTYISTEGDVGNYKSTLTDQVFSLDTVIDGTFNAGNTLVDTVNISSYGTMSEGIESIRLAAPKSYERQNRAVTAEDYKSILLDKYPNIDSIAVWGGEDNDPPQYGAVFISIKPKHGLELSPLNKQKIKDDILSKYNILAVTPIITAPEYTYIDIETEVSYNPLTAVLTSGQIEKNIIANIDEFLKLELTQFKSSLRYSKLVNVIDSSDESISNNLTTVKMYKKFYKQISNTTGNYNFQFNNEINPGSVVSSVFGSAVTGTQMAFLDDGQGNVLLYDILNETFINLNQGTIDYENGIIDLTAFTPVIDTNTTISLYATPKSNDISTIRNNLLVLNNSTITMKAE